MRVDLARPGSRGLLGLPVHHAHPLGGGVAVLVEVLEHAPRAPLGRRVDVREGHE